MLRNQQPWSWSLSSRTCHWPRFPFWITLLSTSTTNGRPRLTLLELAIWTRSWRSLENKFFLEIIYLWRVNTSIALWKEILLLDEMFLNESLYWFVLSDNNLLRLFNRLRSFFRHIFINDEIAWNLRCLRCSPNSLSSRENWIVFFICRSMTSSLLMSLLKSGLSNMLKSTRSTMMPLRMQSISSAGFSILSNCISGIPGGDKSFHLWNVDLYASCVILSAVQARDSSSPNWG